MASLSIERAFFKAPSDFFYNLNVLAFSCEVPSVARASSAAMTEFCSTRRHGLNRSCTPDRLRWRYRKRLQRHRSRSCKDPSSLRPTRPADSSSQVCPPSASSAINSAARLQNSSRRSSCRPSLRAVASELCEQGTAHEVHVGIAREREGSVEPDRHEPRLFRMMQLTKPASRATRHRRPPWLRT
jgi:hypothetical protein